MGAVKANVLPRESVRRRGRLAYNHDDDQYDDNDDNREEDDNGPMKHLHVEGVSWADCCGKFHVVSLSSSRRCVVVRAGSFSSVANVVSLQPAFALLANKSQRSVAQVSTLH